MKNWIILFLAIICEVTATTALKQSEGFSRLWPSLIVVIGYALSFYLLALTLKTIPIGVAYAVWAGLGIVLIALIGVVLFKQALDAGAIAGMVLIVSGVLVMNLFSKTIGH